MNRLTNEDKTKIFHPTVSNSISTNWFFFQKWIIEESKQEKWQKNAEETLTLVRRSSTLFCRHFPFVYTSQWNWAMEVHYTESRDVTTSLQGIFFLPFHRGSQPSTGDHSSYIILHFAYLLKIVIFLHLQIQASFRFPYS